MRTGSLVRSHTPSYRYTVAMFPLPYKNVPKYRTRQNVGGISILALNTKIPESAAHIAIQTFSATIPRNQISECQLYLCGPAPAPRPRTETWRASWSRDALWTKREGKRMSRMTSPAPPQTQSLHYQQMRVAAANDGTAPPATYPRSKAARSDQARSPDGIRAPAAIHRTCISTVRVNNPTLRPASASTITHSAAANPTETRFADFRKLPRRANAVFIDRLALPRHERLPTGEHAYLAAGVAGRPRPRGGWPGAGPLGMDACIP
jgi:hypothetical protein